MGKLFSGILLNRLLIFKSIYCPDSKDHYEKSHLKFIKWSLSVHSKASNLGCWGETGHHPLFYEASKLAIDYLNRLENSEDEVLSAAFHE
jgi:hypothetical protein